MCCAVVDVVDVVVIGEYDGCGGAGVVGDEFADVIAGGGRVDVMYATASICVDYIGIVLLHVVMGGVAVGVVVVGVWCACIVAPLVG